MTLKDRIFTAVLALCALLSFFPQYVSSKLIAWMDMMFYFLPFRVLPAEILRSGGLPLWNPYIFCGQPLMANMQSAVLYPPDMLFYALAPGLALKILTFLAFFIMAFSMYMFMRLYKVSEEGSFLSAFLLSFTYYMTIKAVELADLHVMVWLPAVLYFTKKHAMSGKLTDLFLAALALSLSFLGGHAQVFTYAYALFTAYYFFEAITAKRKGAAAEFALINLGLALMVLPQLLMTAEFILRSKRMAPGGLGFYASAGGYMGLEQFAEMFLPFLWAYLANGKAFLNWMGMIDIGILGMLLAALGAVKIADRKHRLFLLSVFTLSFFISFMGSLPFYKAIWENIGFLHAMRYPAKINLLFFFAMCVMAGHGFDLLFRLGHDELKKYVRFTLAAGMAILVSYLMLEFFRAPLLSFYKKAYAGGMTIEAFIDNALIFDSFLKSFLIYVPIALAAVFLIYLAAAKDVKNTAMKYTLLVFAAACSVAYNRGGNNLYAPLDYMTGGAPALKFLLDDPGFKNKRVLAPGVINQLDYKVNTEEKEALYYYQRDSLFPNVPMMHGVANADGFDSLILADFFRFKTALNAQEKPWDAPEFALLNVKYISSKPELKGKHIELKFKGMTNLYEYKIPSGPAYFMALSKIAPPSGAYDRIGDIEIRSDSRLLYGPRITSGVNYKRINERAFEVALNAPEEGKLIISENYYPGWNAYEDGKKLKVHKANACFMAVGLAAGMHKVVFKYEPLMFFLSMALAIAALILISGAGIGIIAGKVRVRG